MIERFSYHSNKRDTRVVLSNVLTGQISRDLKQLGQL